MKTLQCVAVLLLGSVMLANSALASSYGPNHLYHDQVGNFTPVAVTFATNGQFYQQPRYTQLNPQSKAAFVVQFPQDGQVTLTMPDSVYDNCTVEFKTDQYCFHGVCEYAQHSDVLNNTSAQSPYTCVKLNSREFAVQDK